MHKPFYYENCKRNLIFISYAYEDEVFALWLARKLASFGYGVWIDQLKILGGESWVDEVEEALRERSFRVLAVLSKDSLKKPNPKKERTLALQLEKKWELKDFLITLNVDRTEADWTLSDISWIPFYEGWNHGLRRVLKKLDALDAPKIHRGNEAIAGLSLELNDELLQKKPEFIYSNWLSFADLPETLNVYDISDLDKSELAAWPGFFLGKGMYAVLTPPPKDLASRTHRIDETYPWPKVNYIGDSPVGTVITIILNKALRLAWKNSGCIHLEAQRLHYIPTKFKDADIFRFVDVDGTKTYLRNQGTVHVKKTVGPAETIHHHPAIKSRVRQIGATKFVAELTPAVALLDHERKPIKGSKIGPRRKKVTTMWNNGKWRKRFIAFATLLTEQSENGSMAGIRLKGVHELTTDCMLNESALKDDRGVTTENDTTDMDDTPTMVDIELDELEEWIDE